MRIFPHVIAASCVSVASVCGAQTWSGGAAAGRLKFSDGATESAVGATITAHTMGWLDVSLNPTWATATTVKVGPVPARTVSGLTDLPVSLGLARPLPGEWSPSIGVSLGVTLPTGDTGALGSGHTAFGASVSAGIAPTDHNWFSASAGRSLSNGYSAGLSSSASTSIGFSAGMRKGALQFSGSLSGDVGAEEAGYAPARSIAAGVASPMGGGMSITLDVSAGLSSGSPKWALSLGVGTTPSGVVAATVAPYQRLNKAFGAGAKTKLKPTKP